MTTTADEAAKKQAAVLEEAKKVAAEAALAAAAQKAAHAAEIVAARKEAAAEERARALAVWSHPACVGQDKLAMMLLDKPDDSLSVEAIVALLEAAGQAAPAMTATHTTAAETPPAAPAELSTFDAQYAAGEAAAKLLLGKAA